MRGGALTSTPVDGGFAGRGAGVTSHGVHNALTNGGAPRIFDSRTGVLIDAGGEPSPTDER